MLKEIGDCSVKNNDNVKVFEWAAGIPLIEMYI